MQFLRYCLLWQQVAILIFSQMLLTFLPRTSRGNWSILLFLFSCTLFKEIILMLSFSSLLERDQINADDMQKDSKFHLHYMTYPLLNYVSDSHPSILQHFLTLEHTYVISNFNTIILNMGLKGRHRWKYKVFLKASKWRSFHSLSNDTGLVCPS